MQVRIRHSTSYRFGDIVRLGEHRLMLRPRDSFDLLVLDTRLSLWPRADVRWRHDVYGNSVAVATFRQPSDELRIDSELSLQRYRSTAPRPARTTWRVGVPVAYSPDELTVLKPFLTPVHGDPGGQLLAFASHEAGLARLGEHPLIALSHAVHGRLRYTQRFEEGTQAPHETMRLGSGSCRDYAWLFIEAARQLGYAARFVTGYLHTEPSDRSEGAERRRLTAEGHSHAWAEVFIPGDGWVEFDPTNQLVADCHLIRIAVTRTPQEASPVSGIFWGTVTAPTPEVSVQVECEDEPQPADAVA